MTFKLCSLVDEKKTNYKDIDWLTVIQLIIIEFDSNMLCLSKAASN